jgi:hypothetical protein
MTMLTKTKIALVAALFVGSAGIALADSEFDPNLGNRYPAYNGPVAAQGAFQSAPTALRRNGQQRTRPVRLQAPGFGEPIARSDDRLPRAFYDQVQPGFPQSPPGAGGN